MSKLYKCTLCNNNKQLNEFYIRKTGRQKGHRVNTMCILCTLSFKKDLRDNNLEKYRSMEKSKRSNNTELYKTIDARYRANNIGVCRERSNASSKAYYLRFPEKLKEKSSKYRARKSTGQPVCLSEENMAKIRSTYKLCKKLSKTTGISYHVDHIIPLKGKDVCGLHVPWNLQVITREENLRKSNKFIEDMI